MTVSGEPVNSKNCITSIKPEAILFDMDGVLVDVSDSYRQAIKKTAEFFLNKNVQLSEITGLKNKGGYNNDWDLTEAILINHDFYVKKEKITKIFQQLYLGDSYNGLIAKESWLIDIKLLNNLKKNYKTGIITGRPRNEAEYCLRRFKTSPYFDVLIAMEDTPKGKGKPDPYGIKLAMNKIGVEKAFYLGDTIDDMKAALAAQIVAVGILTKNGSQEFQERLLFEHGAKYVLKSANHIMEIL